MAEPRKEYHARIWVKLSDGILPEPALSNADLQALLVERLGVGDAESPIDSVAVDDPADRRRRRY